MEEASDRSAIIAAQLAELEGSDVIVYVSDTMPGVFTGPKSNMVILTTEADVRYLWIRLDTSRLSPTDRITALGHELQHAREVAEAPEVRDSKGLARLYRRIGWESSPNRFESNEAQAVAVRIRKEIERNAKAARSARVETRHHRPGP